MLGDKGSALGNRDECERRRECEQGRDGALNLRRRQRLWVAYKQQVQQRLEQRRTVPVHPLRKVIPRRTRTGRA